MKITDAPYVDKSIIYMYVPADHPYMQAARAAASSSTCYKQKTGAVIVNANGIVSGGNNAVATPQESCPRADMPTGQGYELCHDTCGGNLHAEVSACEHLDEVEEKTGDNILFLYGHWWCCENCCNTMKAHGINKVVLVEDAGPETVWFE